MLRLLVVTFVVMPIVELAVILRVGHAIGVLDTLALLVAVSLVGAWLVKREGLGVARRMQASLAAGRMPGLELVDAFLVLLAGALLVAPGFVSDVLAILLLLPPTRAVVRGVVLKRLRHRIAGPDQRGPGRQGVIDR